MLQQELAPTPTLFVIVSLAGVKVVRLGEELIEVDVGRDEAKLNVGKDDLLMGSEMLGKVGTSTTFRQKAVVCIQIKPAVTAEGDVFSNN